MIYSIRLDPCVLAAACQRVAVKGILPRRMSAGSLIQAALFDYAGSLPDDVAARVLHEHKLPCPAELEIPPSDGILAIMEQLEVENEN